MDALIEACLMGMDIFLKVLRVTEQVWHHDRNKGEDCSTLGVNSSLLQLFHACRHDSTASTPLTSVKAKSDIIAFSTAASSSGSRTDKP